MFIFQYILYLEHAVEIIMAWYIVFHSQKPRVYDSWGVCSEYIIGFSGAVSRATRQGYRLRKLMLLFLIIKMNFGSQNKSHKRQKMSLKSGV
jgi:hypothetical protein